MNENKFYNCCIPVNENKYDFKKDYSITICKHVLRHHSKTTVNGSCSANVGLTTILQLLKVWQLMLDKCQKANNESCCQQLQPLHNVGATIACYLGGKIPANVIWYKFLCYNWTKKIIWVEKKQYLSVEESTVPGQPCI